MPVGTDEYLTLPGRTASVESSFFNTPSTTFWRAKMSTTNQNSTISQLLKRHDKLCELVSDFDQELVAMQCSLDQLRDELGTAGTVAPMRTRRRGKEVEKIRAALQSSARNGVKRVRIIPTGAGPARVSIEKGNAFDMSASLWALLCALCDGKTPSPDHFVGFKTWDEIGGLVAEGTEPPQHRHAIQQNLCRLRDVLYRNAEPAGGANPFLIQTLRAVGARFLLRSDGELVIRGERE